MILSFPVKDRTMPELLAANRIGTAERKIRTPDVQFVVDYRRSAGVGIVILIARESRLPQSLACRRIQTIKVIADILLAGHCQRPQRFLPRRIQSRLLEPLGPLARIVEFAVDDRDEFLKILQLRRLAS